MDRGRWRSELSYLLSLRVLPFRVAVFMVRSRLDALRNGDEFSLASAIRADELAALLDCARGRLAVVELGTGTAWSSIALALADGRRRVVSYDPVVRIERERYLRLVAPSVRARIELLALPDAAGPRGAGRVELLFVDSSHDRESVLAAFSAWRGALAEGAVVAFHDFDHPDYPGVRDAIEQLGLEGEVEGGLFVWRAPA